MRTVRLSSALDWQSDAACRGMDPDGSIFYPETVVVRGRKKFRDERPAKQVCASCPVRIECQDFGMSEVFGVWGGLGEAERESLRKLSRAVASS